MAGAGVIDESVVINRAVDEVYSFYTDMSNLPRFLGDVLHVQVVDRDRARWTVAMPLGLKIRWTTKVTVREPSRHFAFQTGLLGVTSTWSLWFEPVDAKTTAVQEQLSIPGGRLTLIALRFVGKHPAAEVRSNLHRLKQVLETGRATDSSNTMGKRFG